jgi:hypothetical protein
MKVQSRSVGLLHFLPRNFFQDITEIRDFHFDLEHIKERRFLVGKTKVKGWINN